MDQRLFTAASWLPFLVVASLVLVTPTKTDEPAQKDEVAEQKAQYSKSGTVEWVGQELHIPIADEAGDGVLVLALQDIPDVMRAFAQGPPRTGSVAAAAQENPQTEPPANDTESKAERRPGIAKAPSSLDGANYVIKVTEEAVSFERNGESFKVAGDMVGKAAAFFNGYNGINPSERSEVFVDLENNSGWFYVGQSFRLSSIIGIIAMSIIVGLAALGVFVIIRLRRKHAHLVKMQQQTIKAREEERRLLAAELHDGPVQELQFLARTVGKDGVDNHQHEVHDVLDTVSGALRKICNELRPPILTHFGLEPAMRWFSDQLHRRYDDLEISLTLDSGGKSLDSEQELAFFRIMQESLNNVRKHANATHVDVHFSIDDDWAELLVVDNGDGFEVPRNFSKLGVDGHLGLLGITQRAEAIGAGIEFQSEKGEGTTVRVVARIRSEAPEKNKLVSFIKA